MNSIVEKSPNAAIVAFGTGSFTARLIVDALADYRYSLVWDKDAVTGFLNAKRQPMRSHEDLAVFYRRQPTYNPQMVYTGRSSHSRGKKAERKINHWGGFENTDEDPAKDHRAAIPTLHASSGRANATVHVLDRVRRRERARQRRREAEADDSEGLVETFAQHYEQASREAEQGDTQHDAA